MVITQWSFKVLNSQLAIHFHASVVLLCLSWKVQYKLYVLGPCSCKHQHTLKIITDEFIQRIHFAIQMILCDKTSIVNIQHLFGLTYYDFSTL